MKKVIILALFILISTVMSGCGETLSGVGKDVNRMGNGVSTFFFRQSG